MGAGCWAPASSLPSPSDKLQYNYMDFGTRTYSFTIAPAGVSFSETLDAKIRQNIHLIKVGLNFRWDCPVIARY